MFSRSIRKCLTPCWKRKIHVDLTKAIVNTTDADRCMEKMRNAQEKFYEYSQKQVDDIFEKVSDNMKNHIVELAKMAVEESKIGCVEDKILKNLYATEHSFAMYKNTKTVGIIDHDNDLGITRIAEPVGPICAILPCTNPTATVIFKSLYSLKTRNCIVFLPHPRTKNCSIYTADLIQKYATQAGAPDDIVMSCLPSREISEYIMRHKESKFLLATGGSDMVKNCYSIGKPAIGVGPGNTPVVIDDTYDLKEAVNSIMIGKTFDWGVPCITEQSVIVAGEHYSNAKKILTDRGVYFLNEDEKQKVASVFMLNGTRVNPDIVGKSPQAIAESACINIPPLALALGVEVSGIGEQEVFSHEKMSPILALYHASDFKMAVEMARELVLFGGPGHSSCLYSNNEKNIQWFQKRLPTCHVNINMPALGGIGIRYNPNVAPSMTVGCGIQGGSMASVNVGPNELIQIKTVARKIIHQHVDILPQIINDTLINAVRSFSLSREKVVIVSDPYTPTNDLIHFLRSERHDVMILTNLTNDIDNIEKNLDLMDDFRPTIIFALGNQQTVDAAKLLRLRHDNHHISIEKLTAPFIEYERHDDLLGLRRNLCLVVVPSLPDSTDMSPFTQNLQSGNNRVNIYSQSLRPNIVVYDCQVQDMDRLYKQSYTMFLQGIEAFVSTSSSEKSRQIILDALRQIFIQLNATSPNTDKLTDACASLSIAISNSGVGLGTSMATQMSSAFQISFPSIFVALMPHIIEYNSSPCPKRGAVSPLYPYPMAGIHYSLLATTLGLKQSQDLIKALCSISKNLGFENIRTLVDHNLFHTKLDTLCASTFADPLHSTNPRMVFIPDIHKLYCQILKE